MRKFTVCYAADVSCYADDIEIEARDEAHALEVARKVFEEHTHELDPDYGSGMENYRIVAITNDDGQDWHEGAEIYPSEEPELIDVVGDALFKLVLMLEGESGTGMSHWGDFPAYAEAVKALRECGKLTKSEAESREVVA